MTVKENDKTIYSKITSVLITFVAYLVKNFISRLEACSEAVLFASFGDSLCDLLKKANDLTVKLCDNALQILSISVYIRIQHYNKNVLIAVARLACLDIRSGNE